MAAILRIVESESESESVRIDKNLVSKYREWSTRTGRSIKFLMERVLFDAANYFGEGQICGLREARQQSLGSNGGHDTSSASPKPPNIS